MVDSKPNPMSEISLKFRKDDEFSLIAKSATVYWEGEIAGVRGLFDYHSVVEIGQQQQQQQQQHQQQQQQQ